MSIENRPIPQEAESLIRNINRRQGLLALISNKEKGDIPDIIVKETLLKFLDKQYKGLEESEITDLNQRIFMLINRAASIAHNRQDTSPVTSMYAYQQKGAREIDENPYYEFKNEVKSIITLCQKYGVSIKSITGMQHGLGVPKIETLDSLLKRD